MTTQTQARQQTQQVDQIAPSRLPISAAVAKEFDLQPTEWRVLVDQIFPAAKSVEAIMMALAYCRKRNLDIFKKPVHIVPMWSSTKNEMVETVWPGIAEIRTTASRTGDYAGIDEVEFGPMVDRTFEGVVERWENRQRVSSKVTKMVRYPEWAKVTVYRMNRGVRCAYTARVFWEEMYATLGKNSDLPNDMWGKRPRGQLDKCVEAAALRKAFPEELGSIYAAEEMEGRVIAEGVTIEHEAVIPKQQAPRPPRPGPRPSEHQSRADAPQGGGGKIIDADPVVEPDPIIEADPVIDDEVSGAATDETIGVDNLDLDALAYFDELRDRLAEAQDLATAEEVWTNLDPMARFEGDENAQNTCLNIKNRRVKTLEEKERGK